MSKPSSSSSSTPIRDSTSARVINGLKFLYHSKLSTIEDKYFFPSFHYAPISDSEIEAKPQVLLIGQYSTGKTTFVEHLLQRPYPNSHIGPEPTTDKFIAVVHGKQEKVIKGNSLTVVPELPFGGLSNFGSAFLNKFEASVCPAELLESVTIVDSPGVLSGEKQRISRSYNFADVTKWFAERSDLILLLFDAHKLDISDEFREVIEALKPHDDKVRCVLNKADQIKKEQFVRVYGSLLWSMGKIFQTPEVCRVYTGSFWDQDLVHDDYEEMFKKDGELLIDELKNLPSSAAARKINDMVKRIRLVKVHVCILSYLKGKMPYVFGVEAKQKLLLDNMDVVFEEVKLMYNLSDGDMPELDVFVGNLRSHNFKSFPTLDRNVLKELDELIAKEIPALMGRVGGVSGVYSMSSMLETEHANSTEAMAKKMVEEDAKKILGYEKRRGVLDGGGISLGTVFLVFVVFMVLVLVGFTAFVALATTGKIQGTAAEVALAMLSDTKGKIMGKVAQVAEEENTEL